MKQTTKPNYLIAFILGGFLGWCFEQLQCLGVRKYDSFMQSFTGFNIPFLPIYGFGLMILVYSSDLIRSSNIWLKSFVHAIILSIFEFVSGVLLLLVFNHRYWDYSNLPLNIQGHVYIGSFIAWFIFSLIYEKIKK